PSPNIMRTLRSAHTMRPCIVPCDKVAAMSSAAMSGCARNERAPTPSAPKKVYGFAVVAVMTRGPKCAVAGRTWGSRLARNVRRRGGTVAVDAAQPLDERDFAVVHALAAVAQRLFHGAEESLGDGRKRVYDSEVPL